MDATEVLQLIAPPLALLDWLEAVDASKRRGGDSVPAEIMQWLQRWRDIRGDGDSVIDGRVGDVTNMVRGRVAA